MTAFPFAGPDVDPRQAALIEAATGHTLSWEELERRVEQAAEALVSIGRGLIHLYVQNTPASVVAYLACLAAKRPVALFEAMLPATARQRLTDAYLPQTILAPATHSPAPDNPWSLSGWKQAPAAIPGLGRWDCPEAQPHNPALSLLLSTSGTTGSPKLVRLTKAKVQANADSIREYLGIDAAERAVTSLPMSYSYGLSVINSHMAARAGLLLTMESVVSPGFWKACREQGATSMAGVPFTYQALRRLDLAKVAPAAMRTFTQAGGRMEPSLVAHVHQSVASRGGRLFVMYGQTEATARMSYVPPNRLPEKAGTVGVAIPGGRFTLDHGAAQAGSGLGEIIYHGPNVMQGYAESWADLSKGDELVGVLRTGDLGAFDADGFLSVRGRLKRFAKVYGLRVNLDEVESLLSPLWPSAALAGNDQVKVFLETPRPEDLEAAKARLVEMFSLPASGVVVHAIESLPRMPNGKRDYSQLEAKA